MTEESPDRSTADVVRLLQNVELFEGLPEDDLRQIADIVGEVMLTQGETLFVEGEPGDAFYIVAAGAVEILKSRPNGAEERLAVRRTGEPFGEMALLNQAPRSATARASEATRVMALDGGGFQRLLGGDSLALRVLRGLSTSLRALGVRFASAERIQDRGAGLRMETHRISRVMQARMLPRTAPKVDGFDIAAGTTTEETGRGGSVWDWITLADGRAALLTLDVRQDGFPPAHHLGVTRAVLRSFDHQGVAFPELLPRLNEALAGAASEGMDQFVEVGTLVVDGDALEWACAGRVPGGIIRREGTFEAFTAQGPPLGMMGGFNYRTERFSMGPGDTALVLSHASQGLFLGAADLVAQLHGRPAGDVVSTLHRAVRKAHEEPRTETSVLYARKH